MPMCRIDRARRAVIASAATAACAASLLLATPARMRGQAANPGIWRPVQPAAVDTMSYRALVRLHRRLLAHEDSLIGYATVLVRQGVPWRVRARPRELLTTRRYAGLVGAALLYNAACPFGRAACERDPGGYADSFASIDKVAHGSSALALTSLAVQGGVRPRDAALVTLLGSVGLEATQAQGRGFFSRRDVVANAAGAAAAWQWARLVARRARR